MFQIDDLDAKSGAIAMGEGQNVLFRNGETSIVRVVVVRMDGGQVPRGDGVYHIHTASLLVFGRERESEK